MNRLRMGQRGATTIEMTFVGIPLIFILISVFEMSRGMWNYHTLAYAAKIGVRYSIVHGINCDPNSGSLNTCTTSIAAIATQIQNASVGIDPSRTELTFTPGSTSSTSTSCYMGTPIASPPYGALSGACSGITGTWPPSDGNGTYNGVGRQIEIDIRTPFSSALGMFWPGSKPVSFALVNLGATSQDRIQF